MRLRLLAIALAGALALPAAWAADKSDDQAARKAHRSEGLVLTNARIYTMDGQSRSEIKG